MLRALICSLVLALGACANSGHDARLLPGQSSGTDVLARYGTPVQRWPEADGGQTLEYSSQPFGRTCWMIKLDANDRLVSIEDTLRYASRFSIEAGMTAEQVSRRLGRERSRVFFPLSGEDVWDWNVEPDQSGYLLRFNVHFKEGRVARTSQSMVVPERFPSFFGRD